MDPTSLGVTGGSTAATVLGIYILMKFVIVPKLNTVCIRTKRIEVSQGLIIEDIDTRHPESHLRSKINEEIKRLGVPSHNRPLKDI